MLGNFSYCNPAKLYFGDKSLAYLNSDARHDARGRLPALLPPYPALRPAEVQALRHEVWKVNPEGKTDAEIAEEGLKAMEAWMKELSLAMNISELGATKDMIDGIADATFLLEGG